MPGGTLLETAVRQDVVPAFLIPFAVLDLTL